MATPTRTTQAGKAQPSYFVDQKKGEVNELKALLRNQSVERDPRRKREVVKKVIAYMTLGFDVSRLFSEMVMASSTSDIILKKMCYLFLSNYAAQNEELATLCINTMTKDCQDSDPLVRGLALRSLSSLRLASTLEYLIPVLTKGLDDPSAYVRRNAVMAVLKLYDLDREAVKESGMTEALVSKIRDRDANVSASALMVLSEVTLEEGGIQVDQELIIHLLNRIKEYHEWGQCVILALVAKSRPASEEETFAIMNILDGCLRVANSAVVLGATKCFLRYADSMRNIKDQIYLRLKQPMLTLMASPSHEIRFAVLKHLDVMVTRCPGVFDDQFKQFYCHYNEPTHVKFVKLNILPELTNEENVHELVQELSEYVDDVNAEIAKGAIHAFGRIAIKMPSGADGIINQLLNFMNMDVEYVRTQVVIVIKNLLRKYPDRAPDVIPALPRCLRRVEDPAGKAAVVFMLGEFGAQMRQAPYLLEPIIDSYDDETSTEVKMALLTAVLKLFFARPPEVHGMLQQLLTVMLNDTSDTALHDQALLYYRLLRHDVEEAKRCITCSVGRNPVFTEDRIGELQQRLYVEFNSLAIVYGKDVDQFVDEAHMENPYTQLPHEMAPHEPLQVNTPQAQTPDNFNSSSTAASSQSITSGNDRGSAFPDDLLGLSGGGNDGSESQQNNSNAAHWSLVDTSVDQETFQAKWEQLEEMASLDLILSTAPSADEIEKLATDNKIYCMASGDLGTQLKFYFFGRDCFGVLHLAEVQLEKATKRFTATVKSEEAENAQTFADSLMASIGALL